MHFPFPCSPVSREWSWKKTPIEKKNILEEEALLFGPLVSQQHCNAIVEKVDLKCRLLSKHLSQRTQQHGDCNKPLVNDKFV